MGRKKKETEETVAQPGQQLALAQQPPPLATYVKSDLEAQGTEWAHFLERAASLPCENNDQRAWWVDRLNQAHSLLASLEEKRSALVSPLNLSVKEINSDFGQVTKPLELVKQLCASVLAKFELARAAESVDLRNQAQALALAGDNEGCQAALAKLSGPDASSPYTTLWAWEARVVDKAALPEALKVVDDKALGVLCKAFKDREDPPVVPGVVFTRVASVRVKGGSNA